LPPPHLILLIGELCWGEAMAAVVRDIDLRDEGESFAERLRARTLLVAQMEHKLKTSLTVVLGWASMLELQWDELADQERRAGVGAISRTARQMLAQVEGLLEESQAELSALDLVPVWLDIPAVLMLSTDTYRGTTAVHEISYAGPDTFGASVDPAALQQVLGYLIENAVKYSPEGGSVTLRLDPGDDTFDIAIIDDGVGITEGVDLFAPFTRGNNVGSAPGAGLGLYIVRALVEAMGGTITARRNADTGSTFTLRLPAGDDQPGAPG
jgi:signal transduction histidine kinase